MSGPAREDYDGTSSDIYISHRSLGKDCQNVIDAMRQLGISSNVTPNKSIVWDKLLNRWYEENGCKVTLGGLKPEKIKDMVWLPLQKRFTLDCAFLSISGRYAGCIIDFCRPSICPGSKRSDSAPFL